MKWNAIPSRPTTADPTAGTRAAAAIKEAPRPETIKLAFLCDGGRHRTRSRKEDIDKTVPLTRTYVGTKKIAKRVHVPLGGGQIFSVLLPGKTFVFKEFYITEGTERAQR